LAIAPLASGIAGASTRPLRIGYVVNGPERSIFDEKFELGMQESGYAVGQTLTIDYCHQLRPDHDLRDTMQAFVDACVEAIVVSTRGAVMAGAVRNSASLSRIRGDWPA
jgi:hypothetical protein